MQHVGGSPLDDRIILPKESWKETQSWLDRCKKAPEPWFRDHTNAFLQKAGDLLLEKPVSNEALESKMKTFSVLTSALEINGRVVGVISFVAAGENRYTETHGKLIEAVKEPFGIALYHALRYRKLEQLMAYDWPGNVREFQNIIERALIVGKGRPLSFPGLQPGDSKPSVPVRQAADKRLATLDEVVADHIRLALHHTRGRISGKRGAAEILGMHPNTLRYRMNKLNIK